MANPEHVGIVKQGKGAIAAWRSNHPNGTLDLCYADLRRAHLRGADLSLAEPSEGRASSRLLSSTFEGANLTMADLGGANLCEANLTGANLGDADLGHADLRATNLRKATLSGTKLFWAKLDGADLGEADLVGAEFRTSSLYAASFAGASLGETIFADVDLSNVQGLETIEHVEPSTIGLDTLVRSRGRIPRAFLRGCGVPEAIIEYLPSLMASMQPIQFYSCFISYSHEDKALARRLHNALQGRGIRCWLDEKQLLPGDDIFDQVDRGIRLWDKVLLCASEHSLKSWWVDNEIDKAFRKEQQLMKQYGRKVLALIPLDLDGDIFERWQNGKKDQVLSRLVADFQGWKQDHDKCEQQIERLVQALRADAAARETPPQSRLGQLEGEQPGCGE